MICVSIGRTRHKMVTAEHRHLAENGAKLVELRLDWLSKQPDLGRLLKDRPTEVIVTCRRRRDRGRWRGSEDQRQALLRAAIVAEVEYVDLEEDIAGDIPRYGPTKRIVSHHNFDETPDNLDAIHARLCKLDPDIVKLTTMANSPVDMVRMLKLVQQSEVPTAGFCMGDFGIPSRVLCGKYGSPLTYATFSEERELAPGQLSFEEMQSLYRYDEITPATQVFGVLGDPILHSLSPLLHNAAFRKQELNAVYLPFRIPKDSLVRTLEGFEWLGIQGYSVTIPHKEAVLQAVEEGDGPVQAIGAANTLYRDPAGRWHCANTDYDAALTSLCVGMHADSDETALKGRKVLMLGAGGVARAIGLGVTRAGGVLTISNRSQERADELAEKLDCQVVGWASRSTAYAEIIINCTPMGMHPNVNETPFPQSSFREGTLAFDMVYNPENTLFLKQARERGCRTVSGIEMFIRQAALQFKYFTGEEAPLNELRETLRRGISAVKR